MTFSQLLSPDRVLFLLALVPFLRENGPTPVAEIAQRFGVSEPTVRTLVRFLATAGVPGETESYQAEDLFDIDWDALEHEDLVILTQCVAVDDAPRFAPAESAALVLGLQTLLPLLPETDRVVCEQLIEKISRAKRESHSQRSAESFSLTPDAQPEALAAVTAALSQRLPVHFVYCDARGAETERVVHPQELRQDHGEWYLRGVCVQRAAERVFRVDRMRSVTSVTPAACARAGDPEQHVLDAQHRDASQPHLADASHSDASAQDTSQKTHAAANAADLETEAVGPTQFVVSPYGYSVLSGYEPTLLQRRENGDLLISIDCWYEQAAVHIVQRSPQHITVVAPAAARQRVARWAAQALAAYDQ